MIGRKTLNKAETFEEKGLEESLRVDEREVEEKRREGRGEEKKKKPKQKLYNTSDDEP